VNDIKLSATWNKISSRFLHIEKHNLKLDRNFGSFEKIIFCIREIGLQVWVMFTIYLFRNALQAHPKSFNPKMTKDEKDFFQTLGRHIFVMKHPTDKTKHVSETSFLSCSLIFRAPFLVFIKNFKLCMKL
jgi:hypothetical protein